MLQQLFNFNNQIKKNNSRTRDNVLRSQSQLRSHATQVDVGVWKAEWTMKNYKYERLGLDMELHDNQLKWLKFEENFGVLEIGQLLFSTANVIFFYFFLYSKMGYSIRSDPDHWPLMLDNNTLEMRSPPFKINRTCQNQFKQMVRVYCTQTINIPIYLSMDLHHTLNVELLKPTAYTRRFKNVPKPSTHKEY